MSLPFQLETDLERRIAAEPEWQEGIEWGEARRGHPEGAVKHHIADVLENVDREATSPEERRRLRLARSSTTHSSTRHLLFFRADNATAGKSPRAVEWFQALAAERHDGAVGR